MTGGSSATRRLVLIAMLSAGGLVFFVFESFLPLLPWLRPGLGNVATIIALFLLGFKDATKVTLLRIILGSLVLGRLFTPVFLFAFSGGIVSLVVMGLVLRYLGRVFGPVGISALGAVAHNTVQLGVAYLVFVKSVEVFIFMPVFLLAGVVTGALTGLLAAVVLEKADKHSGLRALMSEAP